ncbi:unnamed protein product [Dracunculus medinensis]|uniref:RNase H domain-containing protein n=1 Tax=Dracunculus medinensis TaxID=318479 RepID=A0A0N4UPD9_DRAME|nr:unnamed protein product [Dracunculus medinensis]
MKDDGQHLKNIVLKPFSPRVLVALCFWMTSSSISGSQLQTYGSTSESAISGAHPAIYVKQSPTTSLIFAKSRVAPIKTMTIPKLELLAILIGVRAAQFIIKQLEFENAQVILWSDSRCALHWIQNHSRLLPRFIQNRVEEIRKAKFAYRYIPSECNPADIATKGISPSDLANFTLWWNRPEWLKEEESNWPHWEYNIKQESDNEETIDEEGE